MRSQRVEFEILPDTPLPPINLHVPEGFPPELELPLAAYRRLEPARVIPGVSVVAVVVAQKAYVPIAPNEAPAVADKTCAVVGVLDTVVHDGAAPEPPDVRT